MDGRGHFTERRDNLKITSIQIRPGSDADTRVKAFAAVVLNGSLSLQGIKIMRGRYGLFLAFPAHSPDSPRKVFEALSMGFRKELQTQVIRAYREWAQPVARVG
jgi:DNA-binding cell septation regulator SpoVG